MGSDGVLRLLKVDAPHLDAAFLPQDQWETLPSVLLVRATDGAPAIISTFLRVAWSARGLHIRFVNHAPPAGYHEGQWDDEAHMDEAVGVFLDPRGDRSEYMAIFVNPYGRVVPARIENPLHRALDRETDMSWDCPGLRTRSWSRRDHWSVELLIPFDGMTPSIHPPTPGDRWTGNFYRLARFPTPTVSAWQPTHTDPVDLHASACFGILEFDAPETGGDY